MYSILYIERYRSVEKVVLPALQQHYRVIVTDTRRDSVEALTQETPNLVLINVPSLRFNLERFCHDIRTQAPDCSVFMLLEKGTRLDQLPRLDGYLRHPLTTLQLLRRLNRILPEEEGEIVAWQGLELDMGGRFLFWNAHQVPFTPKQADLMSAFLQAPEQLLSRVYLMQEVWGTDYMGDTRTLDVHIHWLRKALKTLNAPFVLKTKRGHGYRLLCELPSDPTNAPETETSKD